MLFSDRLNVSWASSPATTILARNLLWALFLLLAGTAIARADGLTVTPTSVTVSTGASVSVKVSGASGTANAKSANAQIASATYANGTATIKGVQAGSTNVVIADARRSLSVPIKVTAAVPTLAVSPTSLSLLVGATGQVQISGSSGTVTVASANARIASASYASNIVTVRGIGVGNTSVVVRDSRSSFSIPVGVSSSSVGTTMPGGYALLAWNDLGMHCVDGADYSIFSILPPYNNLHAQLISTGSAKKVSTGVTLTYEAVSDAAGSINTISSTKTNFWQYVSSLFGTSPAPDIGLTGNPTPSLTPAVMKYNTAQGWFEAEGIPITPMDDSRRKNFYPMVRVVAKDANGRVLATTSNVLPVSDEMTCKGCHSSIATGTSAQLAAKPKAGWVSDVNGERDWKRNILRLHDEKHLGTAAYTSAIGKLGYDTRGLEATANGDRPILCASCHASNALPGTGLAGISAMTAALHTRHSKVGDPATGVQLDAIGNRTACYQCHPGSETKCLRGAMANVVDTSGNVAISCQSCHGTMTSVGNAKRVGWLQQPNCQACHHDGLRETSALNGSGVLKTVTDQRFATSPNKPSAGFSLFRFSTGHGGLQCEACHGATHAEYPSLDANDNVQSIALQGYAGTVTECKACHASVPSTTNGGPHGMHTIGDAWVSAHGDLAKSSTTRQSCAYCHGADFRGSPLSEIKVAKSFRVESSTKSFTAGHAMSCYDCHNGPNGD
jgi:hypothetical protein